VNESISTAAGASNGQLTRPSEIRRLILEAGRLPAERSTTYQILREFPEEPAEPDPLDVADTSEERFGSYQRLIAMDEFRYQPGIAARAVADSALSRR
jgi:FO synthase subunit 2